MKTFIACALVSGLLSGNALAASYKVYDMSAKRNVKRSTSNQTGYAKHETVQLRKTITLRPGQKVGFVVPNHEYRENVSSLGLIGGEHAAVVVRNHLIKRGRDAGKRLVVIKARSQETSSGQAMSTLAGFGIRLGHVNNRGAFVGPTYFSSVEMAAAGL